MGLKERNGRRGRTDNSSHHTSSEVFPAVQLDLRFGSAFSSSGIVPVPPNSSLTLLIAILINKVQWAQSQLLGRLINKKLQD